MWRVCRRGVSMWCVSMCVCRRVCGWRRGASTCVWMSMWSMWYVLTWSVRCGVCRHWCVSTLVCVDVVCRCGVQRVCRRGVRLCVDVVCGVCVDVVCGVCVDVCVCGVSTWCGVCVSTRMCVDVMCVVCVLFIDAMCVKQSY